MKMTAMTYNICSGHNLAYELDIAFSASVIKRVQPDFVTVNEVRNHTSDIGPVHQAWELGRLTGYYPVFGKAIDILGGEYGNAFLSRHPVLEQEVIQIPDRREQAEGPYEHRVVLRCVIEVQGKKITVLGSHFGLMPEEKRSAVDTVLNILKKEGNPVILMGDFNLRPHEEILQPIMQALHDSANGEEKIGTYPSDTPDRKIDYIFVSEEFAVESLQSMDTQCSDHRPLIAVLTLN